MNGPNPVEIPPPPPAPGTQQASSSSSQPDGGASNSTQELLRYGEEAKNSAVQLISSVQAALAVAEDAVREQMRARPYVTLGAAAGAGYVLGGGLASTLTKTLFRAGTKAATGYVTALLLKKAKEQAEAALSSSHEQQPAAAE